MKKLSQVPILQFNRKLHNRLTKVGYKNVTIDFEAVDPIGDFVDNPDLPICTLIRSSAKRVNPMCLFNIPRNANMSYTNKNWFVTEEDFVFAQLIDALSFSEHYMLNPKPSNPPQKT